MTVSTPRTVVCCACRGDLRDPANPTFVVRHAWQKFNGEWLCGSDNGCGGRGFPTARETGHAHPVTLLLTSLLAFVMLAAVMLTFMPANALAHPDPTSCARVDPVGNAITVIGSTGSYRATYRDHDRVTYSRPVPTYVRAIVQLRKGTAARYGCGRA